MNIVVKEHNPIWIQEYEVEAEKIKKILGNELVDSHHIGSTAVKGLKAKPIIDMMLVVKDIKKVDGYEVDFESLGYECMGEFGMAGRRYFRKGGDDRTHQIHTFEETNLIDIERHLAVRDFLITHHKVAAEYGELKSKLAILFPKDIDGYCDGKDEFIKQMEQEALIWYKQSLWSD